MRASRAATRAVQPWSAVSYVAATVVAVALVEAVILGLVLPRLLNGQALSTKLQAQVRGDAKLLAQ